MSDTPHCGGTGFIAIPPSSPGPPEGEGCPGCPDCETRYTRRELELAAEVGFNWGYQWYADHFARGRSGVSGRIAELNGGRRDAQRKAVRVVREQRRER